MASTSVWIVQGEEDIREILVYTLERAGHEVEALATGAAALRALEGATQRGMPRLVLLDLALPDEEGLELLRAIRRAPAMSETGLILLSAPDDEQLVVEGLRLGADDFIAKPFSTRTVVARVQSVLERRIRDPRRDDEQPLIVRGRLKVDPARRRVWYDSQEIEFSEDEFELLHRLATHPGKLFRREQLEPAIGTRSASERRRSLESRVRGVRKILGDGKDLIETERRIGYRFAEEERM